MVSSERARRSRQRRRRAARRAGGVSRSRGAPESAPNQSRGRSLFSEHAREQRMLRLGLGRAFFSATAAFGLGYVAEDLLDMLLRRSPRTTVCRNQGRTRDTRAHDRPFAPQSARDDESRRRAQRVRVEVRVSSVDAAATGAAPTRATRSEGRVGASRAANRERGELLGDGGRLARRTASVRHISNEVLEIVAAVIAVKIVDFSLERLQSVGATGAAHGFALSTLHMRIGDER